MFKTGSLRLLTLALTLLLFAHQAEAQLVRGFVSGTVTDPTNAVIFDRTWLRTRIHHAGLMMTHIVPPAVRGYQWRIHLQRRRADRVELDFPEDRAAFGIMRAPLS